MKKLVLSMILIVALVSSIVPVAVSAAPEGTPISTAAEFESMQSGGTYYLANDIDFGGKVYESYILSEFSGVLDGNNHSLLNYSIDGTGANTDCGTILRANKIGSLEISNLTLGSKDAPIKLTTDAQGKSHGLLFGAQENANTATLTNVTIYGDIRIPSSGKVNAGGYIGYSRAVTFNSCNYYGRVEVGTGPNDADEVYHNGGGFIGSANSDMTFFENCTNYGTIISHCSSVEARAAGLVCYTGYSATFTNCANYGDITVNDCGLQMADGQAAGLVAHANKTSPVIFEDCANYGRVQCSNWCAGFVANATSGAFFDNCVNEGEYTRDAIAKGPFVAYLSETAIVEFESVCTDKTDPNTYYGPEEAETTPATQETTPAEETPVETTPAVEETTPAEEGPVETTPAETTPVSAETTPAPTPDPKGCGSAVVSVGILAVIGGAWIALKKRK